MSYKPSRRQFMGHTVAATAGTFVLIEIAHPNLSWGQEGKYKAGKVNNPATVAGAVTFKGTAPKAIMRAVTDSFEVAGKEPRQWEGLNLGAGNTVKDAVVMINKIPEGKAFSEGKHVTWVEKADIHPRSEGFGLSGPTSVDVENRDPIFHSWILMLGRRQVANVPHPNKDVKQIKIDKPGLYEMRCGPHPWERAFRMVVPHPYYANTSKDGKFEIKDVPAGSYEAVAWAEGFNPKKIPITVTAGSTSFNVEFTDADITEDLKKGG
ncbi:MAG: hypothetical protein KIT79_01275 [Deltaproteobacteria bacterium]|nr:hypothetical protein [Deltaproteobacteria bacterium]